jgi:lysophospholipase L1-like esterase
MKRVTLIGDSIRIGYQDVVRRGLRGVAEVWAPDENGGDSRNVLSRLDEWILSRPPEIVHLNCGLHDVKREFGASEPVVPLPEYRQNVERILAAVIEDGQAVPLWAMTTPVNQEQHHAVKDFDRFASDVEAYNRAAREVCERLGVCTNDLHAVVEEAGRDGLLQADGVHFTPGGYELLGRAVTRAVRNNL